MVGYTRLLWKEGSNWFSVSCQPGTASGGYTRLSWKEDCNWFSMSGQPGTASGGYTRLSRKEGSNWFSTSGQPGTASDEYTRLSWKEGRNCHGRKQIGFQCPVNPVLLVVGIQDYHGRKEAIGFQCLVNLVLLVVGMQGYHRGRKEATSGQPGTASIQYWVFKAIIMEEKKQLVFNAQSTWYC